MEKYYEIPDGKKDLSKLDWNYISAREILSEAFIEKYKDRVFWYKISEYQNISSKFALKFKKLVDWSLLSNSKKLTPELIKKYNINIENNWLYKSKEEKMQAIRNCGLYEVQEDYVIAYKSTLENGVSIFDKKFKYKVRESYESLCDYNCNNKNSFGLSAWTKE